MFKVSATNIHNLTPTPVPVEGPGIWYERLKAVFYDSSKRCWTGLRDPSERQSLKLLASILETKLGLKVPPDKIDKYLIDDQTRTFHSVNLELIEHAINSPDEASSALEELNKSDKWISNRAVYLSNIGLSTYPKKALIYGVLISQFEAPAAKKLLDNITGVINIDDKIAKVWLKSRLDREDGLQAFAAFKQETPKFEMALTNPKAHALYGVATNALMLETLLIGLIIEIESSGTRAQAVPELIRENLPEMRRF